MAPSSTASTFSSSLQQAAGAISMEKEQVEHQKRTNGFEACFGKGLDLSEFGAETTSPNTSAAAVLLQAVQRRAVQKQRHEEEEMRLHATVQQRTLNLQHQLEKQKEHDSAAPLTMAAPYTMSNTNEQRRSNSGILTSALISMHGTDTFGGKKVNKKKLKSTNSNKQRVVTTGKRQQGKAAGKATAKKTKRSKYNR